MNTQTPNLQAFTQTATQLQQMIVAGGDTAGLTKTREESWSPAVSFHSHVSKTLSRKLGLHPTGFSVPFRFLPFMYGNVTFGTRNTTPPQYYVLYNEKNIAPFFEDGQHVYPVGTDAKFSVPIGALLQYMVAHSITCTLHWMSVLGDLRNGFKTQEDAERHGILFKLFVEDPETMPFVKGIAELGALVYLRDAEHPIARNFAALHFTTRMIEAAHFTGRDIDQVRKDAPGTLNHFIGDIRSCAIHDLAIKCFEQYPDWIVASKRYEGGINSPLHYGVAMLKIGELVFSQGIAMADLMRRNLGSEFVRSFARLD
jgi:hypothetical protein